MNRWFCIALVGAAILSSPAWAKDNPTPPNNNGNNGKAFGQAGDGNPEYKWSPATDSVQNSNDVHDSTPDNVCGKSIDAAPGRNPHCLSP
jgi:hypothetical protein